MKKEIPTLDEIIEQNPISVGKQQSISEQEEGDLDLEYAIESFEE